MGTKTHQMIVLIFAPKNQSSLTQNGTTDDRTLPKTADIRIPLQG
jgi:hypothetical protein